MIKLRILVVLFCALAFAITLHAQSSNLRTVAPGVWFRTGEPLVLAHGEVITENTMIVEMKDYLVVIDSGTAATARATLADSRLISSKPVKYVFLTHHHFDHVGGNPVWTAAGATTLAFAGVQQEMLRQKSKYELPQQTLDNGGMVLDDGFRRLEFRTYGWAHTLGDGVAFLPKERILFSGDVAINASCNSFFDANVRNWPLVLRKLEELHPLQVLPGHGLPGSAELLSGQRGFLESLIAQIDEAHAQNKPLEALVEMKDGKPSVSRLHFAPEFAPWAVGPFTAAHVATVYAKLAPQPASR